MKKIKISHQCLSHIEVKYKGQKVNLANQLKDRSAFFGFSLLNKVKLKPIDEALVRTYLDKLERIEDMEHKLGYLKLE